MIDHGIIASRVMVPFFCAASFCFGIFDLLQSGAPALGFEKPNNSKSNLQKLVPDIALSRERALSLFYISLVFLSQQSCCKKRHFRRSESAAPRLKNISENQSPKIRRLIFL